MVSRLVFFAHAVSDAHRDPFFPASWPVAVWFVLWNWRWLRALYAAAPGSETEQLVMRGKY